MKPENGLVDLHVFVCTNSKEPGKECCAAKNASRLRDELKALAQKEPVEGLKVRINNSGCLGQCEHGIAIAVYPQGNWLLECQPGDASEVWEKIKKSL